MTYLNDNGRPGPPVSGGDEADTLLGSLERQRATFAWKSGGLDASGLQSTVGASSITLGGLLKHLALGRRGHPRAALRAVAGRRGPVPHRGRRGAGRRRPGPALP